MQKQNSNLQNPTKSINESGTERISNRGNIIDIQFVFPEQNSEEVLEEITAGLTYSGLFQGISLKK